MTARQAFTVTGGGEPEHGAPSLGAAVSVAQDFARRHRRTAGEVSFYVREGGDRARAVVTKHEDGVTTTRVVAAWETSA